MNVFQLDQGTSLIHCTIKRYFLFFALLDQQKGKNFTFENLIFRLIANPKQHFSFISQKKNWSNHVYLFSTKINRILLWILSFLGEEVQWHITKEIVNFKINDLFRTILASGCRKSKKHQLNSQRLVCFRDKFDFYWVVAHLCGKWNNLKRNEMKSLIIYVCTEHLSSHIVYR